MCPRTDVRNQQNAPVIITARLVMPDSRKRKTTADVSAFFAKVAGAVVTA
jgi:hypothetical protein